MKSKQNLFLILLMLFQISAFSQSRLPKQQYDSLMFVWNSASYPDSVRLKAYQDILWYGYVFYEPDSGFMLTENYIAFAQSHNRRKEEARGFNIQGVALTNLGDDQKAITYFEKSLEIKIAIGDKQGIGSSLGNIGTSYAALGDLSKALDYHLQSLAIQEELNDSVGIAGSCANIALLYNYYGDTESAIELGQRALLILNLLGEGHKEAGSMINMASFYQEIGDYKKAEAYLLSAEEIFMNYGDWRAVASVNNNLGTLYSDLNDLPQALLRMEKSVEIYNALGITINLIESYGNIGSIYGQIGDIERSREYHEKAMEIYLTHGKPFGNSSVFTNLGGTYAQSGDYVKALDYYHKALEMAISENNISAIGTGYHNLAAVYQDQGKYDEAISFYLKSIESRTAAEDFVNLGGTYMGLAGLYNNNGNSEKAIEYGEIGIEIALSKGEVDNRIFALHNMHNINVGAKRYELAQKNIYDLIDLVVQSINVNFPILSEREKEFFMPKKLRDFALFFTFALLHQQSHPAMTADAYNHSLLVKGILLKSTAGLKNVILASNDAELISMYNNWIELRKKIAALYSSSEDTKEIESKANALEVELAKKSLAFGDYTSFGKMNWKQIQMQLSPQEVAIEFIRFPGYFESGYEIRYAALLIKSTSEFPEMISLFAESELESILGKFQGNNRTFIEGVYGTREKPDTRLFQLIWGPLEPSLTDIKTVYYSPDGLLHKISFNALWAGEEMYLSEKYQLVSLTTTGKIISKNTDLLESDDNFVIFGGVDYNSDTTEKTMWEYLPGTANETAKISALAEKRKISCLSFTGRAASEEEFKRSSAGAEVLHISTHGFFYPDPDEVDQNAKVETETDLTFRGSTNYASWNFVKNRNSLMRSGLVLSGANDIWDRDPLAKNEDGILTAQEVALLDLRAAKLVVLSACETGLGDIKGSEGVYGLQRAFKMAGAQFILMSLWQVPDEETAEFMTVFYKNLLKTKNVRASFTTAQNVMREKYDPYYWGAFILIE